SWNVDCGTQVVPPSDVRSTVPSTPEAGLSEWLPFPTAQPRSASTNQNPDGLPHTIAVGTQPPGLTPGGRTLIVTGFEKVWVPRLSVPIATSVWVPAGASAQVAWKGGCVDVVMTVPLDQVFGADAGPMTSAN